MYTVPKLADYSDETLSRAVLDATAALKAEIEEFIESGPTLSTAEVLKGKKALRDRWLSRSNGLVSQMNRLWLQAAPPDRKRAAGMAFKSVDAVANTQLDEVQQLQRLFDAQPRRVNIDATLPGIHRKIGVEHPITRTSNEIVGIFKAMGYSVAEGPEIESDYYNFESLNFPPNHPARDTQDTIFIAGQEKKPQRERLLLRTHTSPVQMRTMESQPPPVRVVVPGKVHRHDTADASHSPIFHQIEGLAVDTNITFCDLKGTLDHAMKQLFGASVKTRFYPSFFPFTEPSADVQISCFKCGGKGCRLCKMSGWIEVLGCGMVDPNVFEFVKHNGYDPVRVSGFAFGMGVERIAMLKYGIDDIQLFFQGDVRFLEQFA